MTLCSSAHAGQVTVKPGNDDLKTITAAIESLGEDGGTVRLESGRFVLRGVLRLNSGIDLIGAGPSATIIIGEKPDDMIRIERDNVTLGGFGIRGHAMIWVAASHIRVHDIEAKDMFQDKVGGNEHGAFYIPAWKGNFEDIEFVNCSVERSGWHGFNFTGWSQGSGGKRNTLRDVRLVNCAAVSCGFNSDKEWSVGFYLQDFTQLENMTLKNCRAVDCWEAGFYQEPNYSQVISQTTGLVLENCAAMQNGIRKEAKMGLGNRYSRSGNSHGLQHGAGFFIHNGATLRGCDSSDNAISGFACWDANYGVPNGALVFINCNARRERRFGFAYMYGTGFSAQGCSSDGKPISKSGFKNTYHFAY